jgi:hypothetical protein
MAEIILLRDLPAETQLGGGEDIAWWADQPSPFGGDSIGPKYGCILAYSRRGPARTPAGAFHYAAELVTAKPGPAGAIALLALITRPGGMAREEAFRHWDEHIPLAVQIHHKALSYRQYRFTERLTSEAPDYTGLAVLTFASPEAMRTGIYRTRADEKIIAEDVAEFIAQVETLFATEHRLQAPADA